MVRGELEDTTHWTFANISRPKNKLVREKLQSQLKQMGLVARHSMTPISGFHPNQ